MPGDSLTRRLLRARDHMDRSFAEPLDVATVAAVAHLSASHFAREFRRVFGETPHRYLYRRRIERAAWLLRTTDRPVLEIGLEVGYASPGTFTRTFVRLLGETPTVHRARGRYPAVPSCVIREGARPR